MKLPDAVIDKLQDGESPVTHAAIIEGAEMIIRYTCDGRGIGQTMFHYTPETYVDWFRSMMNEMDPGTGDSTKKNKVTIREKRPLLVPLGHVDRILENVNRGVAAENCPATNAFAARYFRHCTRARAGKVGSKVSPADVRATI